MYLIHTVYAKSQTPLQVLSFNSDIIVRFSTHLDVLNSSLQPRIVLEFFSEVFSVVIKESTLYVLLHGCVVVFSSYYQEVATITTVGEKSILLRLSDLMESAECFSHHLSGPNKSCLTDQSECGMVEMKACGALSQLKKRSLIDPDAEKLIQCLRYEKPSAIVEIMGTLYIIARLQLSIICRTVRIQIDWRYVSHIECNGLLYVLLHDRIVALLHTSIVIDAKNTGRFLNKVHDYLVLGKNRSVCLLDSKDCSAIDTMYLDGVIVDIQSLHSNALLVRASSTVKNELDAYYKVYLQGKKLVRTKLPLESNYEMLLEYCGDLIGMHDTSITLIRNFRPICTKTYIGGRGGWALSDKSVNTALKLERNSCRCARKHYTHRLNGGHIYQRKVYHANTIATITKSTITADNWRSRSQQTKAGINITIIHNLQDLREIQLEDRILNFKVFKNFILYQPTECILKLYDMCIGKVVFMQLFDEPIINFNIADKLTIYFTNKEAEYYILSDSISFCSAIKSNTDGLVCCDDEYTYSLISSGSAPKELQGVGLLFTLHAFYIDPTLYRSDANDREGLPSMLEYRNDDVVIKISGKSINAMRGTINLSRELLENASAVTFYNSNIVIAYASKIAFYIIGKQNLVLQAELDIADAVKLYVIGNLLLVALQDNAFALFRDNILLYKEELLCNVTAACMLGEHLIVGSDDGYVRAYDPEIRFPVCSVYIDGVPISIRTQRIIVHGVEKQICLYYCTNGRLGEFVEVNDMQKILFALEMNPYAYRADQYNVIDRHSALARFDPDKQYAFPDSEIYQALRILGI